MRITTTDRRVNDYPNMCGYCEITTGGQHQGNCPLFQLQIPRVHLLETNRRIRIFKYDDEGNFIKEL